MKLKKLMLLGATTLLASTTILAGCSKKTETPTITPSESGSQGTSTITPSSSISSPVESSTAPVISIYTVSFNLNTGEELDPQKVKKGEAVAKPSNPSRSGYVFAGWYLDEECNNAYDFASPVNSDLILYAKWEEVKKDTYLLTIEYHIGEDVKYDVISNPKLVSFITPSFNDYTFIGYVDEAGADVSLDSVRALELTENKTIVLKAKFDKELEYVNVTLKNGEENNVERLVKGELLNNVVDPSKDGYLFEGWFESFEDTKAFDFSQTTIVSDITLVARFKEINKLNTDFKEYIKLTNASDAASVVKDDDNIKYLEFKNIASEGGMTSIRIDDIGASYDTKIVVVIYMEYNGKLYLTEATIGSFKSIASEYLNLNLDLSQDVINSLTQIVK